MSCPVRAPLRNPERTCGQWDHGAWEGCLPNGMWGRMGRWFAIVQPDIYYAKTWPCPHTSGGPATPILRICRPGAGGARAPSWPRREAETLTWMGNMTQLPGTCTAPGLPETQLGAAGRSERAIWDQVGVGRCEMALGVFLSRLLLLTCKVLVLVYFACCAGSHPSPWFMLQW